VVTHARALESIRALADSNAHKMSSIGTCILRDTSRMWLHLVPSLMTVHTTVSAILRSSLNVRSCSHSRAHC
jgi:hypothetical protein